MKRKASFVIGGADGPTSVFIAGRSGKKNFRARVRQCMYQYRKKKAEKGIRPGAHTLEEVLTYADQKYHVSEVSKTKRKYKEQYLSAKEGLVLAHKPELLGDFREIARPEVWDEAAAEEMCRRMQLRREQVAGIPEDELPMDFHVYEIRIKDGWMELEMDFCQDIFGVSYSGSKKTMKRMKQIARELYLYYGVSKEDKSNRTQRYLSLLAMLSS